MANEPKTASGKKVAPSAIDVPATAAPSKEPARRTRKTPLARLLERQRAIEAQAKR